jgi:hypothetical protein
MIMHSEDVPADDRNPLDLGHFALGFIGFIAASFGIVILSAPIALGGVVLFLWSVAYYCAQSD